MSIFFDHNPTTGVTQHFDYDPIKDEIHLTHTQDVTAFLDAMKEQRLYAKTGVETFGHYADIPAIVEIALRKKGIRLDDKNCTKALIREIETNYPLLKATHKKHG